MLTIFTTVNWDAFLRREPYRLKGKLRVVSPILTSETLVWPKFKTKTTKDGYIGIRSMETHGDKVLDILPVLSSGIEYPNNTPNFSYMCVWVGTVSYLLILSQTVNPSGQLHNSKDSITQSFHWTWTSPHSHWSCQTSSWLKVKGETRTKSLRLKKETNVQTHQIIRLF